MMNHILNSTYLYLTLSLFSMSIFACHRTQVKGTSLSALNHVESVPAIEHVDVSQNLVLKAAERAVNELIGQGQFLIPGLGGKQIGFESINSLVITIDDSGVNGEEFWAMFEDRTVPPIAFSDGDRKVVVMPVSNLKSRADLMKLALEGRLPKAVRSLRSDSSLLHPFCGFVASIASKDQNSTRAMEQMLSNEKYVKYRSEKKYGSTVYHVQCQRYFFDAMEVMKKLSTQTEIKFQYLTLDAFTSLSRL